MFAEMLLILFWLLFFYYWNSDYRRIKNGLLKWKPVLPEIPIFRTVLDIQKSTDVLNSFARYRKKYGDLAVVKIFSQIVITADYKLTEFVLNSNEIIGRPRNYDYLLNWLSTGLLTSTGDKWKKRRHVLTPSFHCQIVQQFIEVFDRGSDILVKKLESEVGKENTDIYNFVCSCVLHNICETAMGVSMMDQENFTYPKSVIRLCEIIQDRKFSLLKMNNYTYPLTPSFWEERRLIKQVHEFTNSIIKARRENNKNDIGNMSFLDTLLDIKIDGEPLTNEDIREEIDVFIFAGHLAVTSAVSFTLYCLSKHPEIQVKVFEEQQSIFERNQNSVIKWSDLQDMKYLEQVIMESLRLYPSVPVYLRITDEDVKYQENIIPKGTTILVNSFNMHRNPEFYCDPEKFDPNRFGDDNKKSVAAFAFIPFCAGPRNCIGQEYAMIEMKIILSKLLRSFRICEVKDYEPILRVDLSLNSDNGVKVKLDKIN